MQAYEGYGFSVNDISCLDMFKLLKTDPKEYQSFLEDWKDSYGSCEENAILAHKDFSDWMESLDRSGSDKAQSIADWINSDIKEQTGIDDVLSAYDDFVFFSAVGFVEENPRCKIIKNRNDFILLIRKYFPEANITFGPLYSGLEWTNEGLYMDN